MRRRFVGDSNALLPLKSGNRLSSRSSSSDVGSESSASVRGYAPSGGGGPADACGRGAGNARVACSPAGGAFRNRNRG